MMNPFLLTETPLDTGITLIEASAGTGKTFTITGLVLRLLLEKRVEKIGRILVVTFTRAATEELKTRTRERLAMAVQVFSGQGEADPLLDDLYQQHGSRGLAILRRALREFDEVAIFTIHSFCQRVLELNALSSGMPFTIDFLEDPRPLVLTVARDFWRRHFYGQYELVAAVANYRGWSPETFVNDWGLYHRYPRTGILPAPSSLKTAVAELTAGVGEIGAVWDRAEIQEIMAAQTFKKGKDLWPPGRLEQYLDQVEAFVLGDHARGLAATASLGVSTLLDRVNRRKKAHSRLADHPFFTHCQALVTGISRLEHALRCAFIKAVDRELAVEKKRANVQVYDDQLTRLAAALGAEKTGERLAGEIRQRYPVALIDEFQDTDLVQYGIFKRVFAPATLFLIGDPKQAIYAFRGADVFAYLKAKHDTAQQYTLTKNWRSSPKMVGAINAIFAKGERAFIYDDIPFTPVESAQVVAELSDDPGPALRWWFQREEENRHGKMAPTSKEPTRYKVFASLTREIGRLLTGGIQIDDRPLHPGDIAVLVRTNRDAQQVEARLRDAGIPAVLARAGDLFATPEVEELERLLAAINAPRDQGSLCAAGATLLWGLDAGRIVGLRTDEGALLAAMEELASWRQGWRESGFMPMLAQLFSAWRVRERLLAFRDGERRLTNYLHAIELAQQALDKFGLSPAGLVAWLTRERTRTDGRDETNELRLDRDAAAVQIVTVHKAKGLEYEIVFCPVAWDGKSGKSGVPFVVHATREQVVFAAPGAPDHDTLYGQHCVEELAGDLRLVYVAMTRAKRRLYLAWGCIGAKKDSGARRAGLGYLLHQPTPLPDCSAEEWAQSVLSNLAVTTSWAGEMEDWVGSQKEYMDMQPLTAPHSPVSCAAYGATDGGLTPRPCTLDRAALKTWRVASYSGFTRGTHAASPGTGKMDDGPTPAPVGELHLFARGVQVGNCLHAILERFPFHTPGEAENEQLVRDTLSRFRLVESGVHRGEEDYDPTAEVLRLATSLAGTRIPGTATELGAIDLSGLFVEWEFHLAMGSVDSSRLAEIFAAHDDHPAAGDYARRLASLPAQRVEGFLKGFIDLLIFDGDRWFVVDWKSNYLGPGHGDYDTRALRNAMEEHHYILQYHLYILALHRYLTFRLGAEYDYDRDVGGAAYMFLRGYAGPDPAGWYTHKPCRELINALAEWLTGEVSP